MEETGMIRKCDWREMYPFLSSFVKTTRCYVYEREPKGRKEREIEIDNKRDGGEEKERKRERDQGVIFFIFSSLLPTPL